MKIRTTTAICAAVLFFFASGSILHALEKSAKDTLAGHFLDRLKEHQSQINPSGGKQSKSHSSSNSSSVGGDIDLNGIPYELSDASVFVNYFIYGLPAFTINQSAQIAETDINQDGETLKLEDMMQLFAIIVGQIEPDETNDITFADGAFMHNDRDAKSIMLLQTVPVDQLWLKFDGEIEPVDTFSNIVSYYYDGSYTRVVADNYESDLSQYFTLFEYTGEGDLVDAQAADYDGAEIEIHTKNCGLGFMCLYPETSVMGDINLNDLQCEVADMMLFRNYLLQGDEVFTINPDTQLSRTDANGDGVPGGIEDYVIMHRGITGEGSCEFHIDSTTPNVTTFTQHNEPERGMASTIDVTTTDTLGAVLLHFAGDILVTSLPLNYEVISNFENGQTTTLIVPVLSVPLSSNYLLSGQLIGYNGTGNLIAAKTGSYKGVKVNANVDFSSDIGDDNDLLPQKFVVHQNYPNPFNNETRITFELPTASLVQFEVINLLGQIVYQKEQRYSAGIHSIPWRGQDYNGKTVTSGVYYYRLIAGDFVESKKMMLLK